MDKKNTIYSVQALRGIAAILVLLFHYRVEVNKTFHGVGDLLFINGSIGVDLFFLISGFIVFYVSNRSNDGKDSAISFLIKRLCRIIPPYYLITLCVAGNSLESWTETLKSMLFIPLDGNFVGPVYGYARLYVGWTLNYEVFFYLLCSFCILFRQYKWLVLSAAMLMLTTVPAMFFGWNNLDPVRGYDFNLVYLKLITNPIIIEFLIGVGIGWLYSKNIKINSKIFWCVFMVASGMFFAYVYFTGILWGNSPKAFMIPSMLLLYSVIEYEKRFGIHWPKPIIWLGTCSFSIYLIHVQALSLITKAASRLGKHGVDIPGILVAVTALCLTLLLAKYSYELVEVKLSNWLRNGLLRKLQGRSPEVVVR